MWSIFLIGHLYNLNGLYLRNGHQRETGHNVIELCDQNIRIIPSSICDTTQRAYALRESLIWPPTSFASQLRLWIWPMISDHMRPFPNRRTKEDKKNPRRIRTCIYVCTFLVLGQKYIFTHLQKYIEYIYVCVFLVHFPNLGMPPQQPNGYAMKWNDIDF